MKKTKIKLICLALLTCLVTTGCEEALKDDPDTTQENLNKLFSHETPTYEGTNIEIYDEYDRLTKAGDLLIVETYSAKFLDPAGDKLKDRAEPITSAAEDLGYKLEDITYDYVDFEKITYKKATFKFKKEN